MVHRTKEQLLSWTKDISNAGEIKFEYPTYSTNYLFLSINKQYAEKRKEDLDMAKKLEVHYEK